MVAPGLVLSSLKVARRSRNRDLEIFGLQRGIPTAEWAEFSLVKDWVRVQSRNPNGPTLSPTDHAGRIMNPDW